MLVVLGASLGFSSVPEARAGPLVDAAPYGTCDTSPDGLSWLPAPQTCITHGGLSRCWYTYAPPSTAGAQAGKVPLVVALHGSGGCASLPAMGWGSKAEENGFVVLWPQSTAHEWWGEIQTSWNDGGGVFPAEVANVDDLGFIQMLIERALMDHAVLDASRVYLAGHSNGAIMAQRVALQYPGLVAAVASFGGAGAPADPLWPGGQPADGYVATPVMIVLGKLDNVNPFAEVRGPLPGAFRSLQLWASLNGCPETAAIAQQEEQHVRHTYCAAGVETVLIEVPGAGHHPFPPGSGSFTVSKTERIAECPFRGPPDFYEPDCRFFVLDTVQIAWDFLRSFSSEGGARTAPGRS